MIGQQSNVERSREQGKKTYLVDMIVELAKMAADIGEDAMARDLMAAIGRPVSMPEVAGEDNRS